ncbi:hypothetical protein QL285_071283 [Trifolium repens]|nr:hypothetical protein QL285_071283 [Trifolium repens]
MATGYCFCIFTVDAEEFSHSGSPFYCLDILDKDEHTKASNQNAKSSNKIFIQCLRATCWSFMTKAVAGN